MRGCYPPPCKAPPLPHREVLQKKKSSIFCLYFILKATKPHNQPPSLQPPYICVCGVGAHAAPQCHHPGAFSMVSITPNLLLLPSSYPTSPPGGRRATPGLYGCPYTTPFRRNAGRLCRRLYLRAFIPENPSLPPLLNLFSEGITQPATRAGGCPSIPPDPIDVPPQPRPLSSSSSAPGPLRGSSPRL